jgi:hypothetical protein
VHEEQLVSATFRAFRPAEPRLCAKANLAMILAQRFKKKKKKI